VILALQTHDSHAYFGEPVTEDLAPGYFQVIKEPMSFREMKRRAASRQYTCFRELARDFELICSNVRPLPPRGSSPPRTPERG